MEELERGQLEFFAEVAGLDDPSSLSAGQQLLLAERFEHLFPEARTDPLDAIRQRQLGVPDEASEEQIVWARLLHLNELTKSRILMVLEGSPITVQKSFYWSPDRRCWLEDAPLELEGRYNRVLAHATEPPRPFPFKRCPHCQRIFVPRRANMKFCSGDCTRAANELARRASKRDWNREYMRKRRNSAKETS